MNRTIRAKLSGDTVRMSFVSSTVAFALSRGMTMQEIEDLTDIQGPDLADPDRRVPDWALPAIWRELTARFPTEVLPLEMAKATPFAALGGLADGAQFAATLRDALNLIAENERFVADRVEHVLEEADGEASFSIRHPLDGTDLGRTSESGLGILHRLIVELLEIEGALERVEVGHARYGPEGFHDAYFGVPVRFDCRRYALVFSAAALEKPIKRSNAQLFAYCRQYLRQARERALADTQRSPLQTLTRAIIDNAEMGLFSVRAAASTAGVSQRQAQRMAQANDRTVNDLILEVRMNLAEDLLNEQDASVEQIAVSLGYSDDRAFRRAFGRWAGCSPSEFRRRPPSR